MSITLTERAAHRVRQSLEARGHGLGLRLGVRSSGCSGLSYTIEFADERRPEDVEVESCGVALFVDPKSFVYLTGTALDFVRDGLNEGFRFDNPNSKAECGCGESFSV